MQKPEMLQEILEAVHFMYEDYPNIETDCLLYLSSLKSNALKTIRLSNRAMDNLEEMGRCSNCGTLMQIYHHKVTHPELEGWPVEDIVEYYCPNCDMGGGDY